MDIVTIIRNIVSPLGSTLVIVLPRVLILFGGLVALVYVLNFIRYVIGDRSARIGGFYLRSLPYAGYKRFHSQKWNLDHMN